MRRSGVSLQLTFTARGFGKKQRPEQDRAETVAMLEGTKEAVASELMAHIEHAVTHEWRRSVI